jgi:hypothetical protein
MNLKDVLVQLREERDRLNAAIVNLERLEYGRHRGPGRPPGFMTKNHSNNGNHNFTIPDSEPDGSST